MMVPLRSSDSFVATWSLMVLVLLPTLLCSLAGAGRGLVRNLLLLSCSIRNLQLLDKMIE